MIRFVQILILFFFITGCPQKKNQLPAFKLPDTILYRGENPDLTTFTGNCINDASAFFIDKFRFGDTVKINNDGAVNTLLDTDVISGDSAYIHRLRDSISSDGLQIIPDYNKSIPINWSLIAKRGIYYPIYVVNETNSDKLFNARERYVVAIQEAKGRDEKWRPFESRRFNFIGKKRWVLILHPHEYAMFIAAKYEGSYKTLLRVRMKIGDVIYISKAFEGTVNESQFRFDTTSYQYREYKNDKSISITRRFLGAIPIEPD